MKKNYLGAILTGILHFIIPVGILIFMHIALSDFIEMWSDMGIELPPITNSIIDFGRVMQSSWFIAMQVILILCSASGFLYFKIYQKAGKWQARGYSAVIFLAEILLALIVAYSVYIPAQATGFEEQPASTTSESAPKHSPETMFDFMKEQSAEILHVKVIEVNGGEQDEDGVEEWNALCHSITIIKGSIQADRKFGVSFNRFNHKGNIEPIAFEKDKHYIIFLKNPAKHDRKGGIDLGYRPLTDRKLGVQPYSDSLLQQLLDYVRGRK